MSTEIFRLISPLLDDVSKERLNQLIASSSVHDKGQDEEEIISTADDKDSSNNNNAEDFYNTIYELLSDEKGTIRKSYDDILWEFVNELIRALDSSLPNSALSYVNWQLEITNSKICQSILKILNWISLNASPREFLLILQEMESSSFFNISFCTRLILIGLVKEALKRIDKEKRFSFLESLLPNILSTLNNDVIVEQQQKLQHAKEKKKAVVDEEDDEDEDDDKDEDDDDDDEEEEEDDRSVKIIGQGEEEQLQQKNTEFDTRWEYPLACIIDFISTFISDLNIQVPIENNNSNDKMTDVIKQQHLFLNAIFQIMAQSSVMNTPQPLNYKGVSLINVIGEMLMGLGVSWNYVLTTDPRLRAKQRDIELEDMFLEQGLEDDDLVSEGEEEDDSSTTVIKKSQPAQKTSAVDEDDDEDDDDEETTSYEVIYDLDLPYSGIGYYFYSLLLRPSTVSTTFLTGSTAGGDTTPQQQQPQHSRLPSPLSPMSMLLSNLPYLTSLLQESTNYKSGFKAIQIISFLQKRIKPSSISVPLDYLVSSNASKESSSSSFATWMVDESPVMVEPAFHFLQLVQCTIAFMIDNAWGGNTTNSITNNASQSSSHITDDDKAYFLSPKVLDILSIPLNLSTCSNGTAILERMDALMNALNLYRYLLIRDQKDQKTGVWARSKIIGIRDQVLDPLVSTLENLKTQYRDSANGDQESLRKALKQISKLGVDKMSNQDIQQASQMVINQIDMVIDIVQRIKELQKTLDKDDN
ncbi:hypothetical protein DFA_05358 [Cavenderia fasciculata]|uniref:Uncharacterized protein n=1 Tax=Cavenderia fasciculata TaxID=261658 RepID=F4PL04_CACFS|nr:uncharacterized protein DFA_05358 [Cavenderia fasciculata]EGG23226.1 hypothetical protein DFA_05358 [Cavenderia fasciculata]|eukprot:XP_004361077.1 hypothetical protein DFA_05358 [Cavenderia fasciculata]